MRFRNAADAIAAGIAMIHQELNLVDELTVAENIELGLTYRGGPTGDRKRLAGPVCIDVHE